MANASRTARRKAERDRRKATRQIPPEVKARIQEIEKAGGSGNIPRLAAAPAPQEEGGNVASPEPVPIPPSAAPPSPEFDIPPGIPQDVPPEIRAMLGMAQAQAAGEEPPKGGKPGAGPVAKARSKRFVDLEKELAVLLTLPGPFFEGGGDSYCAAHFMIQGPLLANRLVMYAETNPATAVLLERIVAAGGFAVVAMAIFSYALPPMLHHGLPAPEGLKKMYHVPEKHVHEEPGEEQDAA
jgi:hypothetical protein